jgi:hypothetical protein
MGTRGRKGLNRRWLQFCISTISGRRRLVAVIAVGLCALIIGITLSRRGMQIVNRGQPVGPLRPMLKAAGTLKKLIPKGMTYAQMEALFGAPEGIDAFGTGIVVYYDDERIAITIDDTDRIIDVRVLVGGRYIAIEEVP